MIVKVEIKDSYVHIHSQDGSIAMTTAPTTPMLARMNGRTTAFFHAKSERGGGKDKDGNEFLNPSEIIDLGDAAPDQAW